MAGEKEEKKKPGLVKRIFKWIGLVVISILLIGAIVFQAPWKVTTLLVIILAACTILPKPYRKWFWLSAAGVVIALIIWVFLPDDIKGWRPYTFDKELAALEAKYAVADEENAAKIYERLLASYDENDFEPNFVEVDFWELARSGPWRSEDYPEVAEWLESHQSTIDTLTEAAKKEKCHFPIQADLVGVGYTMDRLAPMRRWAYLLIRAGNNDLGEDRVNAAIEKYVSTLQMGKHIRQQPALIEMMVGIAVETLAIRQFDKFVITGDITEEHLSIIEKALTEIKQDWSSDLPKFTECEKLLAKNLWGMFYSINPKGEIRLNHNISNAVMSQLPEDMRDEIKLTHWHRKLAKAATILFWLYMPSTPQKVGEVIDKCYERYYAMAEPDFDWQKEPEKPSSIVRLNYRYLVEFTTSILEPAYYRIHYIYLGTIAEQKGSQIIVGLRRYKNKNGRWPGSLEEVKSFAPSETFVDPINNSSFVYKLTEKDFTLYSKGKNNIDDGGEHNDEAGTDDWLIWPERSCKDKEEKEDEEQQ